MRLRLLLLLLLFSSRISAQGLGFRQFTPSDGLPQNTVTTAFEDSEGFLWFGTQDGLCRYDGYGFRVFRNESGNTHSLCDNYVLAIFEDDAHHLWIGCRNGISIFDRHTEQFTTVKTETTKRFYPRNELYFHQSPGKPVRCWGSGLMLEAVNDSLLRQVGKAPLEFSLPGNKEGAIGDSSLTVEGKTFPFPAKGRRIAWSICPDGKLCVCLASAVFCFDPATKTFSNPGFPEGAALPHAIVCDKKNRTWLGTAKGLYLSGDHGWAKVQTTGAPAEESISALYCDSRGITWIGTDYSGLFRYDPFSEVFGQLDGSSMQAKQVWAFAGLSSRELWIGTDNGPRVFVLWPRSCYRDKDDAAWSRTPDFTENAAPVALEGLEALEGKTVTAITTSGDSLVWLGTKGFGIYAYHRRQQKIVAHFGQEEMERKIPGGTVFCFAATNEKLYAGTPHGIAVIDLVKWQTDSLHPQTVSGKVNNDYVLSLYPEGDELWIGTTLGLLHYNVKTHAHESFTHDPTKPASFPNDFVACIQSNPANKNELYIGTLGSGIVVLDRSKQNWRMIDGKNGLTNLSVYGILFAEDKCWASTNDGIAVIDPGTFDTQMLTDRDGIAMDEFSQNAWYKAMNGDLFFGTANGFVCFDPEKITLAQQSPRLAITTLGINYQPLAPDANNISGSRTLPSKIELWPGEKVLSLEYAAFSSGNRPLYYRYRLAGFDDNWVVPANNQRTISYTNLPAGDYTLEIAASFSRDYAGASVLKIPVIVHPPFFMTWWFRIVASLLIIGCIILIVRYFSQRRLREKLRELETQRRIQEERERISRDLHDNVGAQLTYIITTLDNVALKMRKPGNAEVAQEKIETLGGQARHTMQQLRESIWAMNSTSISTEELGRKTQELMLQLAENHEQVQWQVKTETGDRLLSPSVAIQLFRIVQEAVANAFRHALARRIAVHITGENDFLQVTITDDGTGFDPSAEKPGHFGMKNMPQRAAQIGGTFGIQSEKGKGTTICIRIPVG